MDSVDCIYLPPYLEWQVSPSLARDPLSGQVGLEKIVCHILIRLWPYIQYSIVVIQDTPITNRLSRLEALSRFPGGTSRCLPYSTYLLRFGISVPEKSSALRDGCCCTPVRPPLEAKLNPTRIERMTLRMFRNATYVN